MWLMPPHFAHTDTTKVGFEVSEHAAPLGAVIASRQAKLLIWALERV